MRLAMSFPTRQVRRTEKGFGIAVHKSEVYLLKSFGKRATPAILLDIVQTLSDHTIVFLKTSHSRNHVFDTFDDDSVWLWSFTVSYNVVLQEWWSFQLKLRRHPSACIQSPHQFTQTIISVENVYRKANRSMKRNTQKYITRHMSSYLYCRYPSPMLVGPALVSVDDPRVHHNATDCNDDTKYALVVDGLSTRSPSKSYNRYRFQVSNYRACHRSGGRDYGELR